MRSRRGFGVILHGQHRLAAMSKTFERLIVEIDVRVLDVILAERFGIDGEAVILRGDLDASGAQILHRMIAAAMPEFQFVRAAAEGEAEELVAEADAEDRDLADEIANIFLRVRDRLGIAGTVREKHAVEFRI